MKKEIKENGVAIGAMGVAGVCLLTENCQIGLMVVIPATLYQAGAVMKDMLPRKTKNAVDVK